VKTQQLILEALNLPTNAITYYVSQELAALYPKKALLEGSDYAFDLERYAEANFCTIKKADTYIHNQIISGWDGMENKIDNSTENGNFEVTWEGYNLDVLLISFQDGYCKTRYYWILADSKNIAEKFFAAVCEWNSEVRSEILVFEEGYWSKNIELFESIQNATFDNLILPSALKQEIQDDLAKFFDSQETYEDCGLPWKRGILFIGSPGNGKTHAV
jgi:hypothetical protein